MSETTSTAEQEAPDATELITRTEAGELAGVHVTTIDRWANSGHVTRYKVGGLQWVRFDPREIRAMRVPVAEGPGTTTGE